jgi:hypothetical protein
MAINSKISHLKIKKLKNKKAVLKTLEALIASLLIVLFVAFILPTNVRLKSFDNFGVLDGLSKDSEFRKCIINYNLTCVDSYIKSGLPAEYKSSYSFIVTKNINEVPSNIPKKELINENIYISTDGYTHNEYVVRLYYWKKQ